MCESTSRLLPALLLLAVASTAVAQGDPVLWEFQIERAEMRLAQASAELLHQERVLEWTLGLPRDEEFGRLALLTARERLRDDYRSVRSELDRCRLKIDDAQYDERMRTLDLEEMRLSDRLPSYALYAPPVNGRDFVTERLQLRLELLKGEQKHYSERLDTNVTLNDLRALPARDLDATAGELEEITALIDELELQIRMRQLDLEDKRPDDAPWLLEEAALDRRRRPVTLRLGHARDQLHRIVPLVTQGFATQIDLDEAESRVRSLQDELDHIDLDQAEFEYRRAQWMESRK